MEKHLRHNDPPVIARVEKDRIMLDVRTIQEKEFQIVARAVKTLAELNPSKDRPERNP